MNLRAIPSQHVQLAHSRRFHGAWATMKWLASRIGEKAFNLEIADLLWIDADRLIAENSVSAAFTFRFLTPAEVQHFAADPSYEFGTDCVARAATGSHFCFAALDGPRLAGYSWYALGSIGGEHNLGVAMTFPADLAYMYKALTHPAFRGQRLFGTGIRLALQGLSSRGVTKLVTTVHATNFASLTACRRLGFQKIGRFWALGRGPRRWAIRPRAARRFKIQFA